MKHNTSNTNQLRRTTKRDGMLMVALGGFWTVCEANVPKWKMARRLHEVSYDTSCTVIR
jgi:hypothetical protein